MLLHKFEHLIIHRFKITEKELNYFEKPLDDLLNKAIKHNNEKISFLCWEYLTCIKIIKKYYFIFDLLKKRNYYDAWKGLEQNEILILDLKRNQIDLKNYKLISYIEEYIPKFQALYPYKLFISPEYYVTQMRCGICNKIVDPINGCNHIPGRVYLGKICTQIVEEGTIKTTAVVENPQQKYSVMFPDIDNPTKYQLLEYFIPQLDNPYIYWAYSVRTEYINDKTYKINDDERCPCGSKKLYKDCCKSKYPLKPRPHYEFVKI